MTESVSKPRLTKTSFKGQQICFIYTLDILEFNANVMTGNNGAHQRSPYDPGIQK